MAGFKTHITVSTATGIAGGSAAFILYNVPAPTCVLAGALCSVSGMLPDLDSDSGVPLRESLAFSAAAVPMLLVDRFQHLGWPHDTMVLVGAAIYLAVRFGVGALLKKYTVHRGMFHSLPAAVIAGEIAFLLASGDLEIRCFKAGAVILGFLSHLVLDEIWSLDVKRLRIKSSFGTALKFWGQNTWANFSTYAKLVVLTLLVLNDKIWADSVPQTEQLHTIASSLLERIWR